MRGPLKSKALPRHGSVGILWADRPEEVTGVTSSNGGAVPQNPFPTAGDIVVLASWRPHVRFRFYIRRLCWHSARRLPACDTHVARLCVYLFCTTGPRTMRMAQVAPPRPAKSCIGTCSTAPAGGSRNARLSCQAGALELVLEPCWTRRPSIECSAPCPAPP